MESSKVYVVVNVKGGVGKTTTTVNLAAAFSRMGRSVVIVDLDPQASVLAYKARAADPSHFPWPAFNLAPQPAAANMPNAAVSASRRVVSEIKELVGKYDIVLVDSPAGPIGGAVQGALMVADGAIMLVAPGAIDMDVSAATWQIILGAANANPALVPMFVWARVARKSVVLQVMKHATTMDLWSGSVLSARLSERVSYLTASIGGASVFETDDSHAKGEVDLLAQEILDMTEAGNGN